MLWFCVYANSDLLDMKMTSTSKCIKGRKKGSSQCQRVITLCKRLASFQEFAATLHQSATSPVAVADDGETLYQQQNRRPITTCSAVAAAVPTVTSETVPSASMITADTLSQHDGPAVAAAVATVTIETVPSASMIAADTLSQHDGPVVASAIATVHSETTPNVVKVGDDMPLATHGRPSAKKRTSVTKKVSPVPRKSRRNTDNTECNSCGYSYGASDDPLIEDQWMKCTVCKKWSHESCGKYVRKKYMCNMCC